MRAAPLLARGLAALTWLAPVSALAQPVGPRAPAPTPDERWSTRPTLGWELSAGAELGWRTYRKSPTEVDGTGAAGAAISFGVRGRKPYDGDSALSGLAGTRGNGGFDGWVWCAPVACLGVGLLFLPYSAFAGNEWGADVKLHIARDFQAGREGTFLAAGLRPVFRVSVEGSRLRAASILGALAPEIGIEVSTVGSKAVYFELSPYPIALGLNRFAAIEWNLILLRFMAPLGDSTANGRIGTGLSFILP